MQRRGHHFAFLPRAGGPSVAEHLQDDVPLRSVVAPAAWAFRGQQAMFVAGIAIQDGGAEALRDLLPQLGSQGLAASEHQPGPNASPIFFRH